jgi:hypothetical protein
MSQTSTNRFLFRSAPGAIVTPIGGPRETESCYSPYVMQQLEIVLAGADPFAAEATLTIVFPLQDGSGTNGQVVVTIPAATTLADATDLVAAAWNAGPQSLQLYSATSDGVDTITLVARSYNTSIPAASIVGTFSDAHTATTGQTVAAAAPSIVMGRFYTITTVPQPLAISGTPRDARPAATAAGATITTLRGVVGREVNSTMLALPNLQSVPDSYPAGQVWPGVLRGQVYVQVDPASASITEGGQVHVVVAAGAYSMIGAVAAVADGANTVPIFSQPTGNIMATAVSAEENLQPFTTSSGRFVLLKVNRTN